MIFYEKRITTLESSFRTLLKFSQNTTSFIIQQNIENPSKYEELLLFAKSLEVEWLMKLPIKNKMWHCATYKNLDLFKALFCGNIEDYTIGSFSLLEAFIVTIANTTKLDERLFLMKRFQEIWQYCYEFQTLSRITAVSRLSAFIKQQKETEALEVLFEYINRKIV